MSQIPPLKRLYRQRNLSADAYRRRNRLPVPLSDPNGEDDPDAPFRNPEIRTPEERTPEEAVVSADNIRRRKAMIRIAENKKIENRPGFASEVGNANP